MSSTDSITTLRGYIAPLPAGQTCRVTLVDQDVEYPILPRGAGIDLSDMLSALVEVVCSIHEDGDVRLLHVRSYTVLDNPEEGWFDDNA